MRHPKARKTANRHKTQCIRGHAFEGDNVRIRQRGTRTIRECAECIRIRNRATAAKRYAKNKPRPTSAAKPELTTHPAVLLFREELAKRPHLLRAS